MEDAKFFWINRPPAADDIYDTIYTRATMKGTNLPFYLHFLLDFGDYVHAYEDEDNYMEACTLEEIYLRPTRSYKCGQYFLNPQTGYLITHYKWTDIPMTTKIKNMAIRVERHYPSGCEITDRRGNVITDKDPANDDGDNTNSDYEPVNDASDNSDTPPDTSNNSNL